MIDHRVVHGAIEVRLGVVDRLGTLLLGQAQETVLHQVSGQQWVAHLAREQALKVFRVLEKQPLEV